MTNWLRFVDPAFYQKEPYLLGTGAQIPRYTDDAQVSVRVTVLATDRLLLIATAIVVLSGYALITIPATWTRIDVAMLGVAALIALALWRLRSRLRLIILYAAIGALFGAHAHPVSVAPLVGILATCTSVAGTNVVAQQWLVRPQIVTWAAFATLVVVGAYATAFNVQAVVLHLPGAIATIAAGYLGVCIIAGRIRRAELLSRPDGVLSLPQTIVPLLNRSHDHAVICWYV